MKQKQSLQMVSFAFQLLVGLIVISPILLAISMSFMTPSQLATFPPRFLPESLHLSNYRAAFRNVSLLRLMSNSFIVCATVITAQITTCSFAGYAFAFFDFPYKNTIFIIVLATMMIPQDAIIIANYLTISQLHLTDTYTALVAPYLTSAMGIFLMRQYFMTIPQELKEASMIDGCSDIKFLGVILLPLSKPVIASLGIYVFIQTYNQFLWPLLVTNKMEMRTVQIGMALIKSGESVNYCAVIAGAVLILLPAVMVFICGQKYLVQGMTAGAVKG